MWEEEQKGVRALRGVRFCMCLSTAYLLGLGLSHSGR